MITLPKINSNTFSKFHLSLPAIMLAVVILGSFIFQANFRNSHFQECDSAGVFYQLKNFPTSGLNFIALSYQNSGGLISKDQAHQILNNPKLSKVTEPLYKKYSKDLIAEKLSESSPVATFRYAEISLLGIVPLPYFLRTAFALPLTTTYSPAAGLFYGLITGPNASYQIFMSRVIVLNLLLFHIATALLYLTAKKLQINRWPASITSIFFLFSISLYSSGFSAGSTIWIIFSGILWLYLLAFYLETPDLLKKISVASGILILFNYLIGLFWLSFILIYWLKTLPPEPNNKFKNALYALAKLLWAQKFALSLFMICLICFYPPGQGVRAVSEFSHFASDFYFTILNFFAFNTAPGLWEIVQFIFGSLLVTWSLCYLVQNRHKNLFNSTLLGIFSLYLATVIFKILGFGPTRHMLFLAPPLFLTIAILTEMLWGKFSYFLKIRGYIATILFIGLSAIGLVSVNLRHKVALDLTTNIGADTDVNAVGIFDCSYNLLYHNWQPATFVNFINPKNFQEGQTYLYVSQTTEFSSALTEWQKKFIINLEELNSYKKETNAFFTAYNPGFANKLFLFSRPNNIYTTKFKINSIAPR